MGGIIKDIKHVEKENKKEKQLNKYLNLTSIPFQMGGGSLFRRVTRQKIYFDKKYFTIIFVLIAVLAFLIPCN